MRRRLLMVLGVVAVLGFTAGARAAEQSYDRWLMEFKERAAAEGVSSQTLEAAFADVVPDEDVVRLDRKQPENKITLTRYLANSVTPRRIAKGRALLEEHRELLEQVGRKYGVQPEYIVALWGIETDYGNNTGVFSVIQALTTLAYEGRRAEFFSKELIAALKILDADHITLEKFTGSWAGAMGNCQFMPSTFLNFAVDGDGDGARDIWESPPDYFASIANYLHSLGWDDKQSWGQRVRVPKHFKAADANISVGRTAGEWTKRGLLDANGAPLGRGERKLYAIYPGTEEEGVYLVTENYKALLQWNRSRYFATAVGTLANAIGE